MAGGQLVTLDDLAQRNVANSDPRSFVERSIDGPLVIDEVQFAPSLFRAWKAVDGDMRPGCLCVLSSGESRFCAVGLSSSSLCVGEHAPPDVGGDAALQAAHRFVGGLPSAILRSKNWRPSLERILTGVTAIRCTAEFSGSELFSYRCAS